MGEFTDLFVSSIKSSDSEIMGKLEESDLELKELESLVQDSFHAEGFEEIEQNGVVAVDAGRNQVEFRNGLRMLVSRAQAHSTVGEDGRSLSLDFLRASRGSYRDFRSATWQLQEVEAALNAASEMEDGVVMIDGSLLTRLRVMPSELDVSDGKSRNMRLINRFQDLLDLVEERDLDLIGVSKDSETQVFGRKLIENYIEERTDAEFKQLRYQETDVGEFVRENSLSEHEDMLRLYSSAFTDNAILGRLTEQPGLTRPLRVGMINREFRKRTERLKEAGPERYADRNLQGAVEETGSEFVTDALSSLLEFPSIRTVHWRPETGAQPIRVDIPDHSESLVDCEGVEFVDRFPKHILRVLQSGYAGESMHNVWISSADSSANLKNSEMENVFLPLVSKVLETDLQQYMKRRDRRA